MTVPLRWGILGATSQVARQAVLPALAASASSEVVAAASRDAHGAGWAPYHRLLADPSIEAVYLPLPNSLHREWTLRAADAGKHVLCEKPLACSAAEAAEMAAACETAGVVLMEAYMTPFHPRAGVLSEAVARGGLGDLRFGRSTFTFTHRNRADHRWRPEMGGGALLDVGVYCLSPLLAAAGRPPVTVASTEVRDGTGVDASFSGWLDFGAGFTAAFSVSFEAPERQHLELVGTSATALVEDAFAAGAPGQRGHLLHEDGRVVELAGADDDPYRLMVEHFDAVVRGRAEPMRPPSASIEVLAVFDRLREAAA
ncbi:MAG TPA: Gfo/Idh/MocA family oxidoreductase [Acidimicrobiales bacterium]|nr:Gfo/Idh/MocA family oxidoreductase [Acidimicrobiales bacterium]